jgi:CubicO group peptidase (beta-lactamase class C family)
MDAHDTLAAALPQMLADHATPGCAVVVADAHGLRRVLCAGSRGWAGAHGAIGPETRFAWASVSKGLSALLTAGLASEGVLDLDAPVRRWLPDFALADADAARLCTLRDLLLHRSSLPSGDLLWWRRPLDERQTLELLPHLPSGKAFRSAWQYQNLHYSVLAAVLRAATGRSWQALLHERVLQPLGMTRAVCTCAALTADEDFARPMGPNGLTAPRLLAPLDLHAGGMAGQVAGSIADLGRFLSGCLAKSPGATAIDACLVPQMAGDPAPYPEMLQSTMGLGFSRHAWRGEACWSLAGGMDGYTSQVLALPERGLAVGALANRSANILAWTLAATALDLACGVTAPPWPERMLARKRQWRAEGSERQRQRRAAALSTDPADPATRLGVWSSPAAGPARVEPDARGGLRLQWWSIVARLLPLGEGRYIAVDDDDLCTLEVRFTNDDVLELPVLAHAAPLRLRRA